MAHLISIGTAVPAYLMSQELIAEQMANYLHLSDSKSLELKNLYTQSKIKQRHTVVNNYFDLFKTEPNSKERNKIYKTEAPKLALQAATEALDQWGGTRDEITHVISVTCTGVMAPGIEYVLMDALKLKRSTTRLGINFMGCFGAFNALKCASDIVVANPKNKVLLVCTELCSLHFQNEQILSNALFADGAAAAVVSSDAGLWKIEKSASFGVQATQNLMTWEMAEKGFCMTLSERVPVMIKRSIKQFIEDLLQKIEVPSCEFAIHPGGKSIVEAIEDVCNLDKKQTGASWSVLEQFGNMSSATFLFVLKNAIKTQKEWTVGIGFGPGLSIEGILLKK